MPAIVLTVRFLGERYGGPSHTVTGLASGLARCGLGVDVVTGYHPRIDGTNVVPSSKAVNVHLTPVWQAGPIRLYSRFAQRLESLVAKRHATLIHDNGLWGHNNYQAWRAACFAGVPYLLSPRGMLEPWAMSFKGRKKRVALALYQQRILEGTALFFATSESEYDSIRNAELKAPVAVVPNGIDVALLKNGCLPKVQQVARQQRVALFLSRIHKKKGLINLLQAWAKIDPKGWLLRLAGPDEAGHLTEILDAIRAFGLTDSVQYVGSVSGEAKQRFYREADLFVLPSYSENFGVVVAEALAHGLPVITTRGTPWSDLATYRCGWWVDIGVAPLVEALQEAISLSDHERGEMGGRGRMFVQRYNWDVIAAQTVSAYQWLLGKGDKPGCIRTD